MITAIMRKLRQFIAGLFSPTVITVSPDGSGDYTSIQAALDSIKDASWFKRYTVYVMPGQYRESVVLKSFVNLEGTRQ